MQQYLGFGHKSPLYRQAYCTVTEYWLCTITSICILLVVFNKASISNTPGCRFITPGSLDVDFVLEMFSFYFCISLFEEKE